MNSLYRSSDEKDVFAVCVVQRLEDDALEAALTPTNASAVVL